MMANGYYMGPGAGVGPGFSPGPGYWWGSPVGWTDLDLYDYNNNLGSKPLAYADAFWSSAVVDVISNINVQPTERQGGVAQAQQIRRPRRTTR